MDISVAELKAHLSDVLRRLERGGGPVIIRRRGTPVAVLREWTPADAAPPDHWSSRLRGLASNLDDFEDVMSRVVRSRSASAFRPVDLDD